MNDRTDTKKGRINICALFYNNNHLVCVPSKETLTV